MNALPPPNLGRLLRLNRTLGWREKAWLFGVTFLADGTTIKIDIDGIKEGDADRYLLLDAVGLLNGLLALGVRLSVIRSEFVVRVHGGPMSVIGTMVELAYAMEVEDRAAILDGYELVGQKEPEPGSAQAME